MPGTQDDVGPLAPGVHEFANGDEGCEVASVSTGSFESALERRIDIINRLSSAIQRRNV